MENVWFSGKGNQVLKSKELTILKFLSSQDGWVTSFSMSALLNISVRSIKSYISDINYQTPGLIESSRKGFFVSDKERLANVISEKKLPSAPQSSEDRKRYILRKLFLEEGQCNLDTLAGEMCISPITLVNELPKLKSELSDFDLVIKTKNNLISIEGPEINKKKLISKLIYEDSENSFLSIKLMQSYLPNYDLLAVKDIISDSLRSNHYFMDDFSLLNLVLHIAITMERKRLYSVLTENGPIKWKTLVSEKIHSIVTGLTGRIEKRFGIEFLQSEIYHFALLVMTRAVSDSVNDVNVDQLSEFVGDNVVKLMSLMQEKTKEAYNISIVNSDFTVRFSLHIKNLLVRLRHNIVLRNPQMLEIKNSYPFIYDVSVFIANIITQETGFILSEDEISYLALYLGVLIEERKVIKHEVRAVLVNPQYFLDSSDLANKLMITFENSLLLTGIVSSHEDLDSYSGYDLIITTIPFFSETARPCIKISAYLTNKDVLAVSKKIEEVLKDRIKSRVESKLRLMFKEELFFVNDDLKNQSDVIENLAGTLESRGYVDSSFKKKIFERELVSSSAYLNIAIPHPFEMCALNSAIAVSLHPNAILWNNRKVNIVFLLAINIRDSLFFKDIFDFITEVISEEKKQKSILEIKTFDQFIATLVSYSKL